MSPARNPKILIVTPEIAALPPGMDSGNGPIVAKAGGLADVTAGLVTALFELGADVHVALPNYRRLFHIDPAAFGSDALRSYKSQLPHGRIHLAEDSIFYYRASVYGDSAAENPRSAVRFQREVINHIVPDVDPDLIHCNDWMTGLIPAMARRQGIPCLFTLHNVHSYDLPLAVVEESGLDPREFWTWLYYREHPGSYEDARGRCRVDLLASGIFAAHFVNTVSPTFLSEIAAGWHDIIPGHVRAEIRNKLHAGCAAGILNAPPTGFDPGTDAWLIRNYTPPDHHHGKAANKDVFQQDVGLERDPEAPLLFWPSRLDPAQKGCELLTDILHRVMDRHRDRHLQIAVVADGPFQRHFHDIRDWHGLHGRLAVHGFDERLSHLGYAAADFVLMPSRFEPCGLPQMIGARYGALPIVHDTGGLHDTVTHINVAADTGNGFVFETCDGNGLDWAIAEAVQFQGLPAQVRRHAVARIMTAAARNFSHAVTAQRYFQLYERMLERPLVNGRNGQH